MLITPNQPFRSYRELVANWHTARIFQAKLIDNGHRVLTAVLDHASRTLPAVPRYIKASRPSAPSQGTKVHDMVQKPAWHCCPSCCLCCRCSSRFDIRVHRNSPFRIVNIQQVQCFPINASCACPRLALILINSPALPDHDAVSWRVFETVPCAWRI